MKTKELSKVELVKNNMSEEMIELLYDLNESSCSGVETTVKFIEDSIHFLLMNFSPVLSRDFLRLGRFSDLLAPADRSGV